MQVPSSAERALVALERQGKTGICVAIDGSFSAVVGVSDTIKPEAAPTVRALENLGVEVWMVTGDNARTAKAVASMVGINQAHVMAEVLPEGKAEVRF